MGCMWWGVCSGVYVVGVCVCWVGICPCPPSRVFPPPDGKVLV